MADLSMDTDPRPMPADLPPRLRDLYVDRQLCLALQVASSLVTRIYRGLLDPLGLTYPQYLVLIALWEAETPLTMRDLRRSLSMDTGTLTPLVKRMEGAGLVARARDTADERLVWVSLTSAGWDLREQVADVRCEVVRRLPMAEADIADLREKLQVMNAALQAQAPEEN
ncbi:MarR family winged helix-turn-helix transcriptional regulator [Phenylobacterium sp.]|uniref:MarR family winged helix-turn-helix transcriptional regulator n=1 Tax=Phenylobacterium sp. TaxID=1871053 RepID=UPI0026121510|nr:MarR family transcriptional regulator [Phenylobacterium sp.]